MMTAINFLYKYKCADHLFGVRMISCENHSIVWAENGFMDLIFGYHQIVEYHKYG